MNEMPWFPLFVARFTNSRSVRSMTPEQVGVFILLLCHQWDGGPIPTDENVWPSLTNGAPIDVVRTVVERSFTIVREGWINEHLEEVRNQQKVRAERLSLAGKIAGKASGKSRRAKKDNNLERSLNDRDESVQRSLNDFEPIRERSITTVTTTTGKEERTTKKEGKSKRKRTVYPVEFEEIWQLHPRGPKAKALEEYVEAVPDRVQQDELAACLGRYVRSELHENFHGHDLFRWIRDDRWEEFANGTRRFPQGARRPGGYRDPAAEIDYDALRLELGGSSQ